MNRFRPAADKALVKPTFFVGDFARSSVPLRDEEVHGVSMKKPRFMRMAILGRTLLVPALLLIPQSLLATTATGSMNVTATVIATCTVVVTGMAFGSYTNTAASQSTATITPTCSNSTPYTIALNAGASSGASVSARAMFVVGTPAVLLSYGLYSDTARSVNFVTSASITGTGAAQPVTVYGNVPSGQTIAPRGVPGYDHRDHQLLT